MSVSFIKSQVGCRILEKTLKKCFLSEISKQSFRQYRIFSHAVKPFQIIPNILSESYSSTFLQVKPIFIVKRHSSTEQKTKLSSFEVISRPSFFNTLKVSYLKLTARKLLANLGMENFLVNSTEPLVIVTDLISKSRFSELKGLLTDECIAEVQKNFELLTPSQRNHIAVKKEDIIVLAFIDWEFIQDNKQPEKTLFQVTVAYHIIENYLENLKRHQFDFDVFTVYNCRFIRECTEGVTDQWTINAINLQRLGEYAPRMN